MSAAPEPVQVRRSFWQEVLDRAREGEERGPQMLRALDSPWLLLPFAAVLAMLARWVPEAPLQQDVLLAFAVWAGARRWGLDMVRPTLVVCLVAIVSLPQLAWWGGLWTIPVLLAACRFGAEPSALAALISRRRLASSDWLLLGAFILCPVVGFIGYQPAVTLWLRPGALPLLLLFGIAGASSVRRRGLLGLVAAGVAAYWLLLPFRPYGGLENYFDYRFGIAPGDALEYCLAFLAGRLLARPAPAAAWQAFSAYLIWILMFVIAVTTMMLRVGHGPLGTDSASLLSRTLESAHRLDFENLTLVSPELLFIQAIIVARLAAGPMSRLTKGAKTGFIFGALLLLALPTPFAVLVAQGFPTVVDKSFIWGIVVSDSGMTDATAVATWRALALFLQALLVAHVAFRAASSVLPAPSMTEGEASLIFGLYGRIWPLAVPAQFFCLAALSLGIAIGKAPPVTDLANDMMADANYSDENVTALENITGSGLFDNLASDVSVDDPKPAPKDRRRTRRGEQDSEWNVADMSDVAAAINVESTEYLTSQQGRGEQTTANTTR